MEVKLLNDLAVVFDNPYLKIALLLLSLTMIVAMIVNDK